MLTPKRVNQLENLVFLFMNYYGISLHSAINKILDLIREHYTICVAAEARLPWSNNDKRFNAHLREYVAYWRYAKIDIKTTFDLDNC